MNPAPQQDRRGLTVIELGAPPIVALQARPDRAQAATSTHADAASKSYLREIVVSADNRIAVSPQKVPITIKGCVRRTDGRKPASTIGVHCSEAVITTTRNF